MGPVPFAPGAADAPAANPALDPNLTFATFAVAGDPVARLAHDVAFSVSGAAPPFDLVYLYGPTGSGKTHLLHAVGAQVLDRGRGRVVGLISAADRAIGRHVDRLLAEEVDVLLVDDIELLPEWTLDALTFVIDRRDALVVCTAACPPALVTNAAPRLRSRLSGGVVVEACYPDRPARLAILAAGARSLGVDAPSEVIELLADLGPPDPRVLTGALRRLAVAASAKRAPIDVGFARACVVDLFGPPPAAVLTTTTIVEATAAALGFTVAQLCGPGRPKALCAARQTAMFLARRLTTASYPAIGRALGGKDHTTAMAAVDRVELQLRAGDTATRRRLEAVLQILGVADRSPVLAVGTREVGPATYDTPSPRVAAPVPVPVRAPIAPAAAQARAAPAPVPETVAPGTHRLPAATRAPATTSAQAKTSAPATTSAQATTPAAAPSPSPALAPVPMAAAPTPGSAPAEGTPPASAQVAPAPAPAPGKVAALAPAPAAATTTVARARRASAHGPVSAAGARASVMVGPGAVSPSASRHPAVPGPAGATDAADAVVALVARGLTTSGTRLSLLASVTGIPTDVLQEACENVNPDWPHRAHLIWPHLGVWPVSAEYLVLCGP
jgi:chromosomal replication initiator protein